MFLLTIQIDGHGALLLTKLFSPAAFPTACSRGCQPRVRPFADEVSLKFRERSKDMKDQFAARGGRIDGFGDSLESDPLGFQLDRLLHRRPRRSRRQTASTSPDRACFCCLQVGALHFAATDRVLDDLLERGPLQGDTLPVRILLRCRNDRIANDHSSPACCSSRETFGVAGSGRFAIKPPGHRSEKREPMSAVGESACLGCCRGIRPTATRRSSAQTWPIRSLRGQFVPGPDLLKQQRHA